MTMALRILDFNYAFQDATQLSESSEDSEFPVSNLKKQHRSRIWRMSGNFVIDATNNKLNFKESGGGLELTATLTSGTYTPTTLAAEIVTQLEVAGAAEYTCSMSLSTGKWTIASDGAYLALLTNTGANVGTSVWASIGFAVAADHTGALTYTGANIAIHTEEWVVLDLGSTEAIDSFAMFFDPMRGIQLSDSAVVTLQANATDLWTSPSVSQAITIDTTFDAASHFFSSDQSYRYWRLKIVDPQNTNLFIEVSKIVLAKGTTLGSLPANGFSFDSEDKSKITETQYGHRYADVYPIRRSLSIEYQALSYENLKTMDAIFRRLGSVAPLTVCLDPLGDTFDKDHFLLYGYFDSDFQAKHRIGQYFGQSFSFLEAF